jgi:disulfide bond formation protein DsbB
MYVAHGVMACIAWAAIFPIGGIMIRLLSFRNLVWVHGVLQIFGFCLYTAAVGLGIQLSINPRHWRMNNKHVIIGLIIFILFFVQSFTGYLHHVMFKRHHGQRSIWSYLHLWSGRLCIPLGMINAGFGFQITNKGLDTWEVKTYIVFAVLVWVAYVVSAVVGEARKRKEKTETFSVLRAGDSGSNSRTGSGSEAPMTEKVVPNKLQSEEQANGVAPEVKYEIKA